jgi:hypothetical protein
MKNRILIYSTVFSLLTLLSSCFDEDEKYAKETKAAGDIVISIPDKAIAAPPAGQPALAQPNINLLSGRFAITDNISMTVGLSEGLTNLQINTLASTGVKQEKASFTGVSGSVDWTYPVSTLGINNATPVVGTAIVLELVASNDDRSKEVKRVFTINVLDPFTLAATNPVTAFADSVAVFNFTVPASTTLANVTKVELLVKRGKNGTESIARTKTYAATSAADTIHFRMPGENTAQLDTLFLRFRATFETGKTVIKSTSIRFINIPLGVTTPAVANSLAIFNPAVTTGDTTRAGYDFGKKVHVPKSLPGTTKDILLVVDGLNIGFKAGEGNTTRFLKTTSVAYNAPTWQSLRNAFTAAGVTPVTSVANVFVNDYYIVEIDGATGSSKYAIFKVNAINLTPESNTADNVVFEFKSR